MRSAVSLALVFLFACTGATAETRKAPRSKLATPYDYTYGIYLNGHKVGWMRTALEVGSDVTMTTDLTAAVGGMGQIAQMELHEKRIYDGTKGRLTALSFRQSATGSRVVVEGKVTDGDMELRVTAGKATSVQHAKVAETLGDALILSTLAKDAKVGMTRTAWHFDPSVQKNLEVENTVVERETRLLDGVPTPLMRVESKYHGLGITESAWVDGEGKIIESKVGGFFVARLEPPDVAKRLDYSQDILVSAVVRAPVPITDPETRPTLKLTMTGFGDTVPPSSVRQQVEAKGGVVHLTLTRDAEPTPLPLADAAKAAGEAGAEFLKPTPFIQSTAPEIVETAKRVVGDAPTVFAATTRLVHFVYGHIQDAYVPAYSNALEALESARGDCTEHAVLFVALARALGIPARVAVGVGYWEQGGGFGWHAWAEVLDGKRWYTVDPTWDQPIADATHIKLAEGDPAEQARIVMLLGSLKITAVD